MDSFTDTFNPREDRYNPKRASEQFHQLWPESKNRLSCIDNLAASITVAHSAGSNSWELTMHSSSIRLNAGPVEVLSLYKDEVKFLCNRPIDLPDDNKYEIESGTDGDECYYKAVPIPSVACYVPINELPQLIPSVRESHNLYIQIAASRRHSTLWTEAFSPAVIEYLESELNQSLPRPDYYVINTRSKQQQQTDTDKTEELIIEGSKYRVTTAAYERDPRARKLCIEKHGLMCSICGFSF